MRPGPGRQVRDKDLKLSKDQPKLKPKTELRFPHPQTFFLAHTLSLLYDTFKFHLKPNTCDIFTHSEIFVQLCWWGNHERMLPKDMQLCSGVNGVWTHVHLTPGPWSSLQIIRSKDWSRNNCKWRMVLSLNEAGQCDSHLASVLVIYWHVTVFPQTCSLLQYTHSFCFFFFFLRCHMACGILVLWPGIKPMSPSVEAWILNH